MKRAAKTQAKIAAEGQRGWRWGWQGEEPGGGRQETGGSRKCCTAKKKKKLRTELWLMTDALTAWQTNWQGMVREGRGYRVQEVQGVQGAWQTGRLSLTYFIDNFLQQRSVFNLSQACGKLLLTGCQRCPRLHKLIRKSKQRRRCLAPSSPTNPTSSSIRPVLLFGHLVGTRLLLRSKRPNRNRIVEQFLDAPENDF